MDIHVYNFKTQLFSIVELSELKLLKLENSINFWTDKGFKGTAVNRVYYRVHCTWMKLPAWFVGMYGTEGMHGTRCGKETDPEVERCSLFDELENVI